MTRITRISRALAVLCILLAYQIGISQEQDLALNPTDTEAQTEYEYENREEVVIVDASSTSKSYPSMEEEMEMYVELHTDQPLAYFFPNPSNGIIWIEHNLGPDATVQIKERNGKVLFEAKKMSAKKLDLTEFASGSYYLEIIKGESRVIRALEVR